MKKSQSLQASCVQSLNSSGLSDMHGDLYNTHGPEIVRFVLRKARAAAKRSAFNREAVQLAKMAGYFLECQRKGTSVSGMDWQALARQRRLVLSLSREPLSPCVK
jgi:hypothetical protein